MTFFEAIVSNHFLLWATLAGLLASVVGGIIGTYVVVKRIAFITGSISHSVLAGIGFSVWLERTQGISSGSPIIGALIASTISAMIIGYIHISYRQREDSVIAAVWSIGMALGVLFIAQTPGFAVELTNFLIGNILWVTPQDLILLAILDAVVIVVVVFLHEKLLAICFDEEQARLQGIHTHRLYILLLTLIAAAVVLLMQVVGIILVMTQLTLPPTIANIFTKKMKSMMLLSIILSCLFSFFGTLLAFQLDLPVGATIALLAGAAYLAAIAKKRLH